MRKELIRTLNDLYNYSTEIHANRYVNSFVDGQPITFAEFKQNTEKVSDMLKSLGIGSGDKVAIYTHNMPNYVVAYFAIVTLGAVAVPLLPDFSATEADNIINHSESKAVFVSQRLRSKIDDLLLPNVKTRIEIDEFFVYDHNTTIEDEPVMCKIHPDDLACIVYTSGTTGKSKGVMLTHHNLVSQVMMTHYIRPVTPEDSFMSILPLPHTYESSLGMLLPFYAGATVYYLEKLATPSILTAALQKVKPTHMLSVPLIIEKVFKNNILPKIQGNFLTKALYKTSFGRKFIHRSAAKKLYKTFGGKLIFFGIGGAKLDAVVERFLYEGKFPYAIGYGLTETSPLLSAALVRNVKPESAGFRLKEVDMTVNNPDPETGVGELWVKTPGLMKGYYKDPETTAAVISPDGWFNTGDLVSVNKSGRIYIKGRLKNVILGSSGENIYPEEIESVINNFKFVQESLVVEQKGKLVAMVKFNYDDLEKQYKQIKEDLGEKYSEVEKMVDELTNELKTYVNARVSRFSQISSVVALSGEFEKTSTMKIKRYLYTTA